MVPNSWLVLIRLVPKVLNNYYVTLCSSNWMLQNFGICLYTICLIAVSWIVLLFTLIVGWYGV